MADPVLDTARAWLVDDPDPDDRAELQSLLDRWPSSAGELADRFSGPLRFGTAGLRGPLRAGPNGMNLAVVRQAAAGLAAWLTGQGATGPVVVGYDARHRSAEFAAETARVVTGTGRDAFVLARPLPTPVLAHAVRVYGAAAGVVVTASHNPPVDNGYKVYLGAELGGDTGAGAQIAEPVDAAIEAAIRDVGPLLAVSSGPDGTVLAHAERSYLDAVVSMVGSTSPRELTVAYTPLHGVGRDLFTRALAASGFPPPAVVATQADPDPDFATVPFPNPEEPGATDLLLALAADSGADLAIAHDPDADRCAVAVPDVDGWRMLHGDEVGVLLADHLMRRGVRGRYATTVVSSSMLKALCAARGLPYGETLTGFKWIVRAGTDLVYGYEEALGYCVSPAMVRDKDGIAAALLVCDLAARLRAEGRTLTDRLDELATECGVHATDQISVRVEDAGEIAAVMRRWRAAPPGTLLDESVTTVEDFAPGADVIVLRSASCRVVARPSGTEPKLKAYLEVAASPRDGVASARQRARARLRDLRAATATALGLPV